MTNIQITAKKAKRLDPVAYKAVKAGQYEHLLSTGAVLFKRDNLYYIGGYAWDDSDITALDLTP